MCTQTGGKEGLNSLMNSKPKDDDPLLRLSQIYLESCNAVLRHQLPISHMALFSVTGALNCQHLWHLEWLLQHHSSSNSLSLWWLFRTLCISRCHVRVIWVLYTAQNILCLWHNYHHHFPSHTYCLVLVGHSHISICDSQPRGTQLFAPDFVRRYFDTRFQKLLSQQSYLHFRVTR